MSHKALSIAILALTALLLFPELGLADPLTVLIGPTDASGQQSWRCYGSPATTAGVNPVNGSCTAVPARSRLVIKHVSVLFIMPPDGQIWMRFGSNLNGPTIMLEATRQIGGLAEDWLASSRDHTVIFEAGEVPQIWVGRVPATSNLGMEIRIDGFLVAVP